MTLYNPLLIQKLENHLKKDPTSPSFCALAQIYCSKGELDKAEQLCQEGLHHHPTYSQAYLILSGIYKNQGQVDKAVQSLNKAKELTPDNPNIYKRLGEIYKKQNNIEKTLEAYKMAASLEPFDQTILTQIKHLEKMTSYSFTPESEKEEKKEIKTSPTSQLSIKDNQKLAKLNEILARVEMHIHKQSTTD